ncbi:MAG: hypothetical protein KF841_00685 [Phycisphaerae bacterium]|nr:hypothetical protein [Phycisphaerae bacterium]
MSKLCLRAIASAFVAIGSTTVAARADFTWSTLDGHAVLLLDQGTVADLGLVIAPDLGFGDGDLPSAIVMDLDPGSDLTFLTASNQIIEMIRGKVRSGTGLSISFGSNHFKLSGIQVAVPEGTKPTSFEGQIVASEDAFPLFSLSDGKASFMNNAIGRILEIRGSNVAITAELAAALGEPKLEGVFIGRLDIHSDVVFAGGDEEPAPQPVPGIGGDPRAPSGADVIVGGVGVSGFNGSNPNDVINNFAIADSIKAYSVATTSCNLGDAELNWFDCSDQNNPQCARHPVISQNMYRLKAGRFEQLGQSWLKHGFCALSENLCQLGCSATGCDTLGIGCSDPYTASRNSSGLGPKSEVNAFTGVFPYPFNLQPSGNSNIRARLQVKVDDLTPSLNPGALYFVEAQYTAQDDAAAGNADNNASHRPISINASLNVSFTGPTVQQIPAIRAWKANDSGVVETDVRVPGEGLMILASKASDNGNGTWHYEYALYNQNSDRSARSFAITVGANTVVTNIGFRDVDYHSGEPYSGTDWTSSIVGGVLTWSTQTFAQNVNANALRWGTLYNFRFDADKPPAQSNGNATIGLFKPGTPTSVTGAAVVPQPAALFISLSTSPPTTLMTPCTPYTFNVTISPGADTLAPGTALLHYTYDGGPAQSVPLTSLGGTLYRADLPPARCGDTPRFYVSGQGTLGETVYFPASAPALGYQPQVATIQNSTLVQADFENGLPAGWSANGLWNFTASCPVVPANCSSGQFAYYGQTGTCTYDTPGQANSGSLSLTVNVPNSYSAELRYCSNFQREGFGVSDWPSVKIGATNIDQPAQGGSTSSGWVERVVNLNNYRGQTVTINFNFDTIDDQDNAYRGWQIDNVRINIAELVCNVVAGDLNGDGVADGRDLQLFTEAAMQQSTNPSHLCTADFNDDGMISHLDIPGMADLLVNLP